MTGAAGAAARRRPTPRLRRTSRWSSIPGAAAADRGDAGVTGSLAVVGLGPGARRVADARGHRAPRRARPTSSATPPTWAWSARSTREPVRHEFDNREEATRARFALDLAAGGRDGRGRVVGRSRCVRDGHRGRRGAPLRGPRCYDDVELTIVPGITAAPRPPRPGRRTAGPRLLRAVAVGRAEAVGGGRATARRGRRAPTSCSRSTTRSRTTGRGSWRGRLEVIARHRAPAHAGRRRPRRRSPGRSGAR